MPPTFCLLQPRAWTPFPLQLDHTPWGNLQGKACGLGLCHPLLIQVIIDHSFFSVHLPSHLSRPLLSPPPRMWQRLPGVQPSPLRPFPGHLLTASGCISLHEGFLQNPSGHSSPEISGCHLVLRRVLNQRVTEPGRVLSVSS